jgi:hypothetical protein
MTLILKLIILEVILKFALLFLFSIFSMSAFAGFDQEHTHLDALLQKYTKKEHFQTLVNYKGIKNHHGELKIYLNEIKKLTKKEFESFSSNQKLSFWINVYNAYTLELIMTHYPVKSIKDIGSFFSGPWSQKVVDVFDEKLSLDNVEHDIIRTKFSEPRIHFAVNCASIGCPSLLREAFTAVKLEDQLQKSSNNFLDNKNKNYSKGKMLYLSKIFDWYGDDFKKKYGSYKKYIKKHYGVSGNMSVKFLDYDWKLNSY